jgi:cell division septal protein FtsQ
MKAKIWKAMQLTSAVLALAVIGYGSYTAIRYLRTSERFQIHQLAVSSLKRVEENQVKAQANVEIGTNVFAVDLDELRERVESLPWVRYALVQRVLPDKIAIKVIERKPIGIARVNGEIFQFDDEAAVLQPHPAFAENFPILDGLRFNTPEENLQKVGIYQRVMEELQGQTQLSEIHIDDSKEVSVVSASDPCLVNLGSGDFKSRWVTYLELKPQIQQRYPEAVRVDLRFRNLVVIKMTDEQTEAKVIWGVEKSSL